MKLTRDNVITEALGFRITTIGTGAPPLDLFRASPCTLIQYKDKFFPVDLGYGAVRNMFNLGLPHQKINRVFFTHLHTDHMLDYGIFLFGGWHSGRMGLTTVGPAGTKEMYEHYIAMNETDIEYRANLGRSLEGIKENMEFIIVAGGESFEMDGVKISTQFVPHTAYTVAYKFEADGKSVVVTGDMTYSDDLIEFAKGADCIVMDANMAPSLANESKAGSFLDNLYKSHATIEQVGEMAQKAGAKSIVLTHFTPHTYLGEAVQAVASQYSGRIFIADDGFMVDVI